MALEVLCRKRGLGTVVRKSAGWISPGFKGEVWGIGSNSSGALGWPSWEIPSVSVFTPLDLDGQIATISAGRLSSLAVTKDGRVFGCGSNDTYELGIGNNSSQYSFVEIPFPEKIISATAGDVSSLFLAESGTVYACGWNYAGQLGLGDAYMVETPTVVPSLPPIKQVSIARNGNPSSTLFLANDGQVYGCGANPWGTLGLGQGVYQQNSPVPLPIDGVKAVAGISSMSVFIKANGDAYVCGVNKYGQLGLGDTTNRYVPTQIPGFGPVKQSAGHGSRCFHLLEDGSIYACGWFPDGELRVPTHVSFAPLSRWIGVSDTAIEYLADGVYRSALGTEVSDVGISPPVLLPTLGTVQELSVGVAYSSSSGSHSLILV